MCGFSFPFWFFRLIKRNCSLFCTNHNSIINPTHRINQSNNFWVIEYNIDIFVSFHRHIVHSYNNLLTISWLIRLNLKYVIAEMIDVLFLSSMSKACDITSTNNINIVLWDKQFLGIFELLNKQLIIIVKIKTCEIISSKKKYLIGR